MQHAETQEDVRERREILRDPLLERAHGEERVAEGSDRPALAAARRMGEAIARQPPSAATQLSPPRGALRGLVRVASSVASA